MSLSAREPCRVLHWLEDKVNTDMTQKISIINLALKGIIKKTILND
jgi:hypothetical protein